MVLLEAMRDLDVARNPLRGLGVSPPQLAFLDWLARSGEARLKEVAAGLHVSRPTASVALKRLEELGLVTRRRDPTDRRAVLFSLTPKGKVIHRRALRFRCRRAERILSGLSPRERIELVRLLEKALLSLSQAEGGGSEDREMRKDP